MKRTTSVLFALLSVVILLGGCHQSQQQQQFKIACQTYRLDNGLEVILHEDRSDPITAVAIQYHVGSNREVPGRTGFAHLFEHMMFQESQHVGQDEFFQKIQSAGGTLNGGTSQDGTTYYEVVPKNVLEMVLWMESDRMGYLLSRVTQEAFVNQQNVVQNEKRQSMDNRPYGYTDEVIRKLLYPAGHPYNWTVIGAMDDLTNATLKDVHDFHQHWYRPNNATLVVAGDFDDAQTRAWIEKYFGEIPAGDPVADPRDAHGAEACIPRRQLRPGARAEHGLPDRRGVSQGHVCPRPAGRLVLAGQEVAAVSGARRREEAGAERLGLQIGVRAFPNVNLTDVETAIHEAFARFEADGFTESDLNRIKIRIRTSFFNGLSSTLNKAFTLARYNEYGGSPDFMAEYFENILAVTRLQHVSQGQAIRADEFRAQGTRRSGGA